MKKTKVLILGAGGAIAQHAIDFLNDEKALELTLFLRNTKQVKQFKNMIVTEGDVLNEKQLNNAMKGQDIVYANLSGNMEKMAELIVNSMKANNVRRLIFIASLGIYDEIPGKFGEWNRKMIGAELVTYRKAADVIEASGLEYTIVRPAWLTDADVVDYELTQKNEPFKGTEVSRKSVGAFVADLILHPQKEVKSSVGVDQPGTEGDKPSFY
ncbi:SDR family oxidoreductase [Bdellovibrio bacteriovorus]|uniref:SDR family oxidoreductase n=1 Tax=Bdellovibrio bacteriovorus TaxID=959 RepID=UPI0035A737E6